MMLGLNTFVFIHHIFYNVNWSLLRQYLNVSLCITKTTKFFCFLCVALLAGNVFLFNTHFIA